jgi:hypothetical protein
MDKQKGRLYLIRSGPYFKIGRTNDLRKRLSQYTCCNPTYIELLGSIEVEDVNTAEKRFHNKLQLLRLPHRREWFYYREEIVNRILRGKSFDGLDLLNERIAALRYNLQKNWSEVIEELEARFGKQLNRSDVFFRYYKQRHDSESRHYEDNLTPSNAR